MYVLWQDLLMAWKIFIDPRYSRRSSGI